MSDVYCMYCLRKFTSGSEKVSENLLNFSPLVATKHTFSFLLHANIAAYEARFTITCLLIVIERP